MNRHRLPALAVALVLLGGGLAAAGASLLAQAAAAPKVIKDGKLDEITLHVEKVPAGADVPILVRRFASDEADLGTGAEGGKKERMADAQKAQQEGPGLLAAELVARLQKLGPYTSITVLEGEAAIPPGAIVIEGKFTKIDPGNRAARYFVGFGAGKSSVQVHGAVKDGSGQTLAEFIQQRVGSMGNAGGNSFDKLVSDSKSIGKDIAEFLSAWAKGKSLD